MNAKELAILIELRDVAEGLTTPEMQLWLSVNSQSTMPISRLELSTLLAEMEGRRQVASVITDDGTKWAITSNGRARLKEAGL